MTETTPTILIVDDKPDIADTYATWLDETYDVRVAYDGFEAIERLDDDVDVVVLDRRMPGRSGDDVLSEIRERGFSCRVAMVTAVEPDFDIVEMGFDDYLVKPVLGDDLHALVDSLLSRAAYDERMQEFFALASKRAVLETEKSDRDLSESAEYRALLDDLDAAREAVDSALEGFEPGDYGAAFRDLGGRAP